MSVLKTLKLIGRRLLLGGQLYLDVLALGNIPEKKKSGIVLIRTDRIGDFFLWLNYAKEYRELYPDENITLIANAAWADFARNFEFWNDVWEIDVRLFNKNPLYRWRFIRRLGSKNFSVAIMPMFSRDILCADTLVRSTRATKRVGSMGDYSNIERKDKLKSDRWYTQLIPSSDAMLTELQRNKNFIEELSGRDFLLNVFQLPIGDPLPESLAQQSPYFVIFPGASWSGRQWGREKFAETTRFLVEKYKWRGLICGSLGENALCQSIADSASVSCVNLAGKTTVAQLAELIRGAELLIANDTSAVHIAATVGTPTIGLLGGGHFGRFLPYPQDILGIKQHIVFNAMPCFNCNWQCTLAHDKNGPVPCISSIPVIDVIAKIKRVTEI